MKLFVKLLIVVLVLGGCQKATLQSPTEVMDRELPDETSYDVRLIQYLDSRYEYQLEAKKIERFNDRHLMKGYGVTLTTYDKENRINSVIQADTTIVDDARNTIFAYGKAKMTSPNGTLSTSKLVWDRAVDEITAPERVTLTRDGSVLYGENMRTNSKLEFVQMDKVSAEGIVKEKDIDW